MCSGSEANAGRDSGDALCHDNDNGVTHRLLPYRWFGHARMYSGHPYDSCTSNVTHSPTTVLPLRCDSIGLNRIIWLSDL